MQVTLPGWDTVSRTARILTGIRKSIVQIHVCRYVEFLLCVGVWHMHIYIDIDDFEPSHEG